MIEHIHVIKYLIIFSFAFIYFFFLNKIKFRVKCKYRSERFDILWVSLVTVPLGFTFPVGLPGD